MRSRTRPCSAVTDVASVPPACSPRGCVPAWYNWGSTFLHSGPVAQLGARMNGIHEVTGSIPVWSTNLRSHVRRRLPTVAHLIRRKTLRGSIEARRRADSPHLQNNGCASQPRRCLQRRLGASRFASEAAQAATRVPRHSNARARRAWPRSCRDAEMRANVDISLPARFADFRTAGQLRLVCGLVNRSIGYGLHRCAGCNRSDHASTSSAASPSLSDRHIGLTHDVGLRLDAHNARPLHCTRRDIDPGRL